MSVLGSSGLGSEVLEKLVGIVRRQNKNADVDVPALEAEIMDLVRAVGRPVDTDEYSVAFREAVARRPSNAAKAKAYRQMARAKNPLNSRWYKGTIISEMEVQAQIACAKRGKGKPKEPLLRSKTAREFSLQQLDDIRRMAKVMAQYHSGLAPPGSSRKTDQDTLLSHLADIYLRAAELNTLGPYDLPYAAGSYFIRFAHVALKPFYGPTEVSPDALSKRWMRLIEHNAQGVPTPWKRSHVKSRKRLKTRPKKWR